ncbi:trehalase-like protein [Pontibacter diazotrophicus]|uniref:Trehalase-like protein n=1 Tax=Pontibacter diazotrophicus TaxID=1400979 RepID=A0A3D8L8C2_9BACT|nr:trehalase-like protein [Pontibacter diazotrophicus]RDV13650.1 trehalase-like protein [Pontibacter diazotrophicus]
MSTSGKEARHNEKQVLSDGEIKAQAREVLYKNMVSGRNAGFDYHFTKPSPGTYPFQYFWDTCFHIFTLTALGEVDMAKKHVHSLFQMQRPDGFVGHMNYWKRLWPARITDLLQLRPRDVPRLYKPHMSALVQPPIAAQAVLRIYQHSQDLCFVKKLLPKLKRYYRWLAENRDFEGEGLLSIITPFESGMDWKASYDPVLKYDKGQAGPLLFWKVLQVDAHNFLKGYDLQAIYKSNRFIVKDAAFNTVYAQNLEALAELCSVAGDEDGQRFLDLAEMTEKSIFRYMYDEADAAFYDLHGHRFKKLRVRTGTIFFPVVLKSVPDEVCRNVLERHLLHKDGFHVPYPVPSLAVDEPAFNPEESLYIWRGPTWVVFNWFLQQFLLKKEHKQEASDLVLSVKQLITRSGFREYYNPFTGEGHGAEDFTWSGLVVDMINSQKEEDS